MTTFSTNGIQLVKEMLTLRRGWESPGQSNKGILAVEWSRREADRNAIYRRIMVTI